MLKQPALLMSTLKTAGMVATAASSNESANVQTLDIQSHGVPRSTSPAGETCNDESTYRSSTMQKWLAPSFFGAITWKYKNDANGRSDDQSSNYMGRRSELTVQVRSPTWFSQKAWDLILCNSYSGFNFHSRVYSIVPMDAPIFQCVKKGDLPGMYELFDKGQASPFDRDASGRTLLQVSSTLGRLLLESDA